jgi:hypothetical protein
MRQHHKDVDVEVEVEVHQGGSSSTFNIIGDFFEGVTTNKSVKSLRR